MPEVTFVEADGTAHVVVAEPGKSLMQIARDHSVPGILGDCGGACSCATCHVFVGQAWMDKLPPRSLDEDLLLEAVPEVLANSRLSCQIKMGEELTGLVVTIPVEQY